MMKQIIQVYDQHFSRAGSEEALRAAKIIVPEIMQLFPDIRSVVQVGCDDGVWLDAFLREKIEDIFGFYDRVNAAPAFLRAEQYQDLNQFYSGSLKKHFDLVLSFDQIRTGQIDQDIMRLCQLGDIVIFTAPLEGDNKDPLQAMGWPSYWAKQFGKQGFQLLDILRARIWGESRIDWHLRQNILVFIGPKAQSGRLVEYKPDRIVDMLHPEALSVLNAQEEENSFYSVSDEEIAWIIGRVLPAHKNLADNWLDEIVAEGHKNIVICSAGMKKGLGPYLIIKARERGLQILAYYDFFLPEDNHLYGVPLITAAELVNYQQDLDVILIASPAYGAKIIQKLEEGMNIDPMLLRGTV